MGIVLYDQSKDAFVTKQYNSWVLMKIHALGKLHSNATDGVYYWDENLQTWVSYDDGL